MVSNGFIVQCQFPQLLTCHTLSGWVKICFTPKCFFDSKQKICQEIKLEGVEVRLERGKSGNFLHFQSEAVGISHGENPMTFHAEIFYRSASQVLIVATDFEEDLWEEKVSGPQKMVSWFWPVCRGFFCLTILTYAGDYYWQKSLDGPCDSFHALLKNGLLLDFLPLLFLIERSEIAILSLVKTPPNSQGIVGQTPRSQRTPMGNPYISPIYTRYLYGTPKFFPLETVIFLGPPLIWRIIPLSKWLVKGVTSQI